MAERVQILIDGGNLHHLVLRKLGIQELDFAFDKFAEFLANGRAITEAGKRFYVGTVREREGDKRSKQAMSRQTTLFTRLRSSGWEIKTSKLRTRIEKVVIDDRVKNYKELLKKGVKEVEFERMREKGIDVKLATDAIVGAIDDKYDTAIIVSSDGDLVPAIDWIRLRQKKKVEYVGFSIAGQNGDDTRPSQTLITHSDIQRILVASDLKPFIEQKLL
ncbi:MAG: NYN domain-containing protein [Candidatus Wildermuthbacteria bacterium]|nr:NYN domain-containing protein [Candidatus Wildermuthbacteria bacterium]